MLPVEITFIEEQSLNTDIFKAMPHSIYTNRCLNQMFEQKSKNYGVYDLRLHANANTTKSLIMFIGLAVALVMWPVITLFIKRKKTRTIDLDDHIFPMMDMPVIILSKAV